MMTEESAVTTLLSWLNNIVGNVVHAGQLNVVYAEQLNVGQVLILINKLYNHAVRRTRQPMAVKKPDKRPPW